MNVCDDMCKAAAELATLITRSPGSLEGRGVEESVQAFASRREACKRHHEVYQALLAFGSSCVARAQERPDP